MKHDGIHLNEATLERLQNRLNGLPQRERQRARTRRLATGFSAAAAAAGLLIWLQLESSSPSTLQAGAWLNQTTPTDIVETLEKGMLESDAEELGALLSDEELDQLSLVKSSES